MPCFSFLFSYWPNIFFLFFFFQDSVLRPFKDYFIHIETSQSVGGAKMGVSQEKPPTYPQIKLDLSHMWDSNPSEHSGEMME